MSIKLLPRDLRPEAGTAIRLKKEAALAAHHHFTLANHYPNPPGKTAVQSGAF